MIPPKRKILSYYTHKCREDRISQVIWYENVTYPDLLRESVRNKNKNHPKLPEVYIRDLTQENYKWAQYHPWGYKLLTEATYQ